MEEHDPTVDKDGRDVSQFVTDAVTALREQPSTHRVLVDYFKTGRLQVWSYRPAMEGDVIHTAIENGYRVDFVKERSMNAPPGTDSVAYMELLPAENQ